MSPYWMVQYLVTLFFLWIANGHEVKSVLEQTSQTSHANTFTQYLISDSAKHSTYQRLFNAAFAGQDNNVFLDIHRKPSSNHMDLKKLEQLYLDYINTDLVNILDNGTVEVGMDAPYYRCMADVMATIKAAKQSRYWAMEMLDATGKPSSGILMGSIFFPGDFDECHDVVVTDQPFDTSYCLTSITVSEIENYKLPKPVPFTLGLCVPDSCDNYSLRQIVELVLFNVKNTTANISSIECKAETVPLTTLAIIVISFSSLLICLIVAATLFDVCYVNGLCYAIWAKPHVDAVHYDEEIDGGILTFANRSIECSHETPINTSKAANEVHSLPGKLLLSFSVYTNTSKLVSCRHPAGSIACINGIKFISMTWVILGHTFLVGMSFERDLIRNGEGFYKHWTFMAVGNAFVSVDSFFVISGCLMTYLVMKQLEESRPTGGFFAYFYFHRLWRLTPTYMLILMTYVALFKYLSNGPIWPQQGLEVDDCSATWWTNLLYINNFVKSDSMCMTWSWYLANDMQFYAVSPLIFLPLFYYGKKALLVPFVFLMGTAIVSGVLSHDYNLPASENQLDVEGANPDYFQVYYIKPYTRIGPYITGMITGYLLYSCKCKAKMSKGVVLVGWMVATAIGLAVVYGVFENTNGDPFSIQVSSLYNALHKIGWGVAVSWVIFACATGHGGFVNTFLSWRIFVPLSRLTLCAYLVHPIVLMFYLFSQRITLYLDAMNLSFLFLGFITMTYAIAFVASLVYESPMLGVEKVFRSHRRSLPSTQPPDEIPIVT